MGNDKDLKKEINNETTPQVSKLNSLYPLYPAYSLKPIFKTCLGLIIVICFSLSTDYLLYNKSSQMPKTPKHGIFLLAYLIAIAIIRIHDNKTTSIFFEMLWGCNVSMLLAAIGCILGRSLMISSGMALVGLDQITWYIDILVYAVLKKFPFGVSAYIMDADATFLRNITSLHHLWFIPYAMYILYQNKQNSLPPGTFMMSYTLGMVLVVLGRFLGPKYCWFPMNETVDRYINTVKTKEPKTKEEVEYLKECISEDNRYHLVYVNVNCGHEFFKHVTLSFFHFANDKGALIYTLYIATISAILSIGPYYLMNFLLQYFSKH